jgi:hypothetical protein
MQPNYQQGFGGQYGMPAQMAYGQQGNMGFPTEMGYGAQGGQPAPQGQDAFGSNMWGVQQQRFG